MTAPTIAQQAVDPDARYHCTKCGAETVGAFALIDTMRWSEREQAAPMWKWMCAHHLRAAVELWSSAEAAESCGVDYVLRLTVGTKF